MLPKRERMRAARVERERERAAGRPGVLVRWARRSLGRTEEPLATVGVACELCGHVQPVTEAWHTAALGEWYCKNRAACWERHRARQTAE